MKTADKRSLSIIIVTLVFILAVSTLVANAANLPADLIMRREFRPGFGASVGKILQVQGEVVVMHADQQEGFWALSALPLYKGDFVVTKPEARVRLELIDESNMTLGSDTKIEISESLYSRKKKSRFSFIRMAIGKARFVVKKIADLRRSRFKVRTSTAVIGVRGTEFIVIAELDRTIVYSVKDAIEVISLIDPEKIVILEESEKTTILENMLPSDPIPFDLEELDRIEKFFIFGAVPGEDQSGIELEKKPAGAEGEGREPGAGGGLQPGGVSPQGFSLGYDIILVPENELVEPTGFDEAEDLIDLTEIIDDPIKTLEVFENTSDDIKMNVQENIEELPDFPDLP